MSKLSTKKLLDQKKSLLAVVNSINGLGSLANDFAPGTLYGVNEKMGNKLGSYDATTGRIVIREEVVGTQYEGRTERLEKSNTGDVVKIVREKNNQYNSNNLVVNNSNGESLGNLPSQLCDAISPLYDEEMLTIDRASISYLEKKSQRGTRAKKAVLFIEIVLTLKEIQVDISNGSLILLIGGDHTRGWVQKIKVIKSSLTMDEAKGLFELYNRYNNEYEADAFNVGYAGLDNLADEITEARKKMQNNMIKDKSYDRNIETETFCEYIRKMVKSEPDRYAGLDAYAEDRFDEFDEFKNILVDSAIDKIDYFWVNMIRVDNHEWEGVSDWGFNHWYDVVELYDPNKKMPFDLNDEELVSVFGFAEFEAFADLSYGC